MLNSLTFRYSIVCVCVYTHCKAMLLQLESRNWLPYSAFAAEFGFLQHEATFEL